MGVSIFHAAISYTKDPSRLCTQMEVLVDCIIIDVIPHFSSSSYWNKMDLNHLLPQNNKGLKGDFERFEFFY